ncbi:glycosyl hydrolase [Cellvibrio sp. NN19]|uniref:glycosyl hydrolase n=1 Tax=Cellvibrio chitinivorans TaxID=3102792 RepID=UPI002B408FA7|nr:glycosyl hydrolase [Cellvibrio sp. NN19]
MKYSSLPFCSFSLSAVLAITLSACGGGGGSGGNSNPTPGTASSQAVSSSSSIPISSIHSSSAPSSNAASISSVISSSSTASNCQVDGKSWSMCTQNQMGWDYENGSYCIATSFCPANRTNLPIIAGRDTPVDTNATSKTRALYTYLRSIWGKSTLTGQQDLTWKDTIDMAERVHADTGKYPALMGYDFMNYGMTANWAEGRQQTEEAIAYSAKGGLVSFAWHWRDPSKLNTADVNNAHFYTADTAFQIPIKDGALDTNSAAYTQINAGIDLIAIELKKLRDADVPVLWRPLHEASGNDGSGWFWWGRTRTDAAPQAYAQILLWRHMYDRLVNYHGLHNLLWVWNGQSAAWYPGDDVVDVISHDIYDNTDNKTYKSQVATYTQARKYSAENKLIALSENSYIPDPDKMATDNAWWLWFMTWNDGNFNETTLESSTHKDNFWSGDYYNTSAHKIKVYNHTNMITLDELPNLTQAN